MPAFTAIIIFEIWQSALTANVTNPDDLLVAVTMFLSRSPCFLLKIELHNLVWRA